MKIRVIKKDGILCPYDEESKRYIDKLSTGDFCEIDIVKKRNQKFHKKYFAMLGTVAEQLDHRVEDIHDFIKDKLGRYDIVSIGGMIKKNYHSISFANMDELEFSVYYDESIQVIAEMLGLDHREVLEELEAEYF